ncbi:MAG: TRAP transporter small permease subunit [Desulfovibrionaceae bacterium]|nr:TRAP transporter small permease subunit [Desulfovibrionaceae bacterium]
MPSIVRTYIRFADGLSTLVGRIALYIVFVMMAILLYSTVSRYIFDSPIIWGVEMAQFCMVSYYILGGGFALLLNSHVRLDVFYSRWSPRKQAKSDVYTSIFLLLYLGFLLWGCISSTMYSIQFNQHNNTAWSPAVWPVKVIMGFGIVVTLLQAVSEFFKAIARSKGIEVDDTIPERLLIEESESGDKAAVEEAPERIPAFPGLPMPELAMNHFRAVKQTLVKNHS